MINIRREAEEVITGKQPRDNNVLKNAPHPMSVIALSEQEWNRCVNYQQGHRRALIAIQQSLFTSAGRLPTPVAPRKEVLADCFAGGRWYVSIRYEVFC